MKDQHNDAYKHKLSSKKLSLVTMTSHPSGGQRKTT